MMSLTCAGGLFHSPQSCERLVARTDHSGERIPFPIRVERNGVFETGLPVFIGVLVGGVPRAWSRGFLRWVSQGMGCDKATSVYIKPVQKSIKDSLLFFLFYIVNSATQVMTHLKSTKDSFLLSF